MSKLEGRCMKCQKNVEIKDVFLNVSESGRRMAKGFCPECNTRVCRILSKNMNVDGSLIEEDEDNVVESEDKKPEAESKYFGGE